MQHLHWPTLSSRSGPELPLFDVRFDRVRHPTSGQEMERLVLSAVDWVNVVALDESGRCLMVRQHRFGISALTLETPGGMVDAGEDSKTAAQRELLEETGYGGGTWSYLGAVQPNPAIHDNLCHHWLAQGVHQVAQPDLGQGEAIALAWLDPSELPRVVATGAVQHALALSALGRVFELWPKPFVQAQPG